MRDDFPRYALPLLSSLAVTMGCGGPSTDDAFLTTDEGEGVLRTQINASDKEEWVYMDLDDTDAFLQEEGATTWDLAMRRQIIRLHRGEHVALAILDGKTFESVDGSPPEESFLVDRGDEEDELAFAEDNGWYTYNILKHELTPRQPRTYVVRSTEGVLYKLSFESYYDAFDHSGYPTFRWARVDADQILDEEEKEPCSEEEREAIIAEAVGDAATPSQGALTLTDTGGVTTATLDASLGGTEAAITSSYLYLDLEAGELLALSDQEARTSRAWHVAIKRSELRSNSADSGPGQLRVARVKGLTNLSMLTDVPASIEESDWRTDDFVDEDCELETFGLDFIETAFGQWYDYDFDTHTPTPRDDIGYIIEDSATGSAWAFRIAGYQEALYTLEWKRLIE